MNSSLDQLDSSGVPHEKLQCGVEFSASSGIRKEQPQEFWLNLNFLLREKVVHQLSARELPLYIILLLSRV